MRAPPPPEIRLKYGCADCVIMWLLKCTFQNDLTPLKEGSFKSCLGKSVVEGVLLRGMKRCTAGIRHARVPIRHEKEKKNLSAHTRLEKTRLKAACFSLHIKHKNPVYEFLYFPKEREEEEGGEKKLQTIHKEDWNGKLWDLWQVADVIDKVQKSQTEAWKTLRMDGHVMKRHCTEWRVEFKPIWKTARSREFCFRLIVRVEDRAYLSEQACIYINATNRNAERTH